MLVTSSSTYEPCFSDCSVADENTFHEFLMRLLVVHVAITENIFDVLLIKNKVRIRFLLDYGVLNLCFNDVDNPHSVRAGKNQNFYQIVDSKTLNMKNC